MRYNLPNSEASVGAGNAQSLHRLDRFLLLFGSGRNSAHAQDFVLLDSEQITEKFETSLLVAKELLDARSPPKYLLYRAEATIAKTNGLDGKIAGKIPALLVSPELAIDYYDITTTTEKLIYVPTSSIPENFDDLGVGEFVTRIQDKFENDLASNSPFVVANASLEHSFLIKVTSPRGNP